MQQLNRLYGEVVVAWRTAFFDMFKSRLTFPKLHMPAHYADQIRRCGAPRHVSTWLFEKAHRTHVQLGWLRSNRRGDVRKQVLRRTMLRAAVEALAAEASTVSRPMRAVLRGARAREVQDGQRAAFVADGFACSEAVLQVGHTTCRWGSIVLQIGSWVELADGGVCCVLAMCCGSDGGPDGGALLVAQRMLHLPCEQLLGGVGRCFDAHGFRFVRNVYYVTLQMRKGGREGNVGGGQNRGLR